MPLISLVIPTRNRDQTLVHSLRTATDQLFADCEIVVSDSAGRAETRVLVETVQRQDPRVRYVSPPEKLGMSEHWDFALDQALGDYVIFMGDDDGIFPGALVKIAAELKRLDMPPLLTWPQSTYMWPEVPDSFFPGLLSVPRIKKATFTNGRRNFPQPPYRLFKMLTRSFPTIYNKSAFSRALINQIKTDSGGVFFRSRIPDIYSGVIASAYVARIPVYGEPLMINAQSARSNGIAFAQPVGKGDDEAKSFVSESTIRIHPVAGGRMTALLQVLWWESALQAQEAVGHRRTVPLPNPASVVKSAMFAAHSIPDDDRFAGEIEVLRNIAAVNGFAEAYEGWLNLARRTPVQGRIQRTGYDVVTDTIFVDTSKLGVRNVADAVKVAAATVQTAHDLSRVAWRTRDSWRYYTEYARTRLNGANIVRYVSTRF